MTDTLTARISRETLLPALVDANRAVVKYHVNHGIEITAHADSGDYAGTVAADCMGEASVSISAPFITDLAKVSVGDALFWQVKGALAPSVLSSGSWMYVVMPVRTAD